MADVGVILWRFQTVRFTRGEGVVADIEVVLAGSNPEVIEGRGVFIDHEIVWAVSNAIFYRAGGGRFNRDRRDFFCRFQTPKLRGVGGVFTDIETVWRLQTPRRHGGPFNRYRRDLAVSRPERTGAGVTTDVDKVYAVSNPCLLYTSPSPRD